MTTLSFQESLNPEGKAIVVNGQTVAVATEQGFEVLKGSLLAALLTSHIVGSDVATPLNVVSYGSNANGNWVRFAGGLQICWNGNYAIANEGTSIAVGSLFGSPDNITWNFPAVFTAIPSYNMFSRSGISDGIIGTGTSASASLSQVKFRIYAPVQYTSAITPVFSLIAIGSWK